MDGRVIAAHTNLRQCNEERDLGHATVGMVESAVSEYHASMREAGYISVVTDEAGKILYAVDNEGGIDRNQFAA